jgi:hypothetical protein
MAKPKPKIEEAAPEKDGDVTPKEHRGLVSPWKAGESGNLNGRPKGSRNRLATDYIEGLAVEFAQYGQEAISHVRKTDPTAFLKIIGGVLPREVLLKATLENKTTISVDFNARDFAQNYNLLREARLRIGSGELPRTLLDITPADLEATGVGEFPNDGEIT